MNEQLLLLFMRYWQTTGEGIKHEMSTHLSGAQSSIHVCCSLLTMWLSGCCGDWLDQVLHVILLLSNHRNDVPLVGAVLLQGLLPPSHEPALLNKDLKQILKSHLQIH